MTPLNKPCVNERKWSLSWKRCGPSGRYFEHKEKSMSSEPANSAEAPEPFVPSNSSEGMDFMEHWCGRCHAESGDNICKVLTMASIGIAVDQWIVRDGKAICTEFQSLESLS